MANPHITRIRVSGQWHEVVGEVHLHSAMTVTLGPNERMDLRQVVTFETTGGETITVLNATTNIEAIATKVG